MKNIIAIVVILIGIQAKANTWAWGENEVEARGTWLKMEKLVKLKKYEEATPSLVWLLKNTPNLNDALYINGIKIYSKRASKEKDGARRVELQDSTLMLYSKRIELFGKEGAVLNREGKVAYKYLYNRPGTNAKLLELYTKIYALNTTKTYPENMYYYMAAACEAYKNGKMEKAQILELFQTSELVFTAHLAKGKKIAKTEKYQGLTAQIFNENVTVTCDEISAQFGNKFEENKDEKGARLIISISVAQKCYSSPSFISAATFLSRIQKSNAALENILANAYLKSDSLEQALAAYERCKELTSDSTKIGKIYIEIANVHAKANRKKLAKENALESLSFDATNRKAYVLIGDFYFQSANQCPSDNKVQSRAIYIAAYNMYVRGGDAIRAAECKSQFPSMEEMFLYNLKPGDSMNTGCWINEQVILQKR